MRVISIEDIKWSLDLKKRFSNYPKLPNALVQQCFTGGDLEHGRVEREYRGSHISIYSFQRRLRNWENNYQMQSINNLNKR
jgi:hypothetical protein